MLVTLIPATSLVVLMLILSRDFKHDKTAYIFELQDETLKRVHLQVNKLLSDEINWTKVYSFNGGIIDYIGVDANLRQSLINLSGYVSFVCKADQNFSFYFDQNRNGWFCRCREFNGERILSILPLNRLISLLKVNSLQSLFLIHKNGVILASEKSADMSRNFFDDFPGIKNQITDNKILGRLDGEYGGESVIGSFESMDIPDLVLISMTPKNAADQATYPFLLKGFLVLGVILAFVIVLGGAIGRSINNQINILLGAFHNYGEGNEDLRLSIKTNSKDEFQRLSIGFNNMAEKIKSLIKEKEGIAAVKHEMKMAGEVQSMFFPSCSKSIENLRIDGAVWSADDCGGDWWYAFVKESKIVIVLGDVTGHGFKAALMTSAARAIMSEMEVKYVNLSEMAYTINRTLLGMSQAAYQMTFCGIEYDTITRKLRLLNCSHEPPIAFQKINGLPVFEFLNDVNNPRLGESKDSIFQDQEITINDPLSFVVFSDGLRELNNPKKVKLGDRRLIDIFQKSLDMNSASKLDWIKQQIKNFQSDEPLSDDVSFVLITFATMQ